MSCSSIGWVEVLLLSHLGSSLIWRMPLGHFVVKASACTNQIALSSQWVFPPYFFHRKKKVRGIYHTNLFCKKFGKRKKELVNKDSIGESARGCRSLQSCIWIDYQGMRLTSIIHIAYWAVKVFSSFYFILFFFYM